MSKAAIEFIMNSLSKQANPEFYGAEYLSNDDYKLRMKRSQNLLDFYGDLLKNNPIESMSFPDLQYLATEMSSRMGRKSSIDGWINPSLYHDLIENKGFDSMVLHIRQNKSEEVIESLMNVIQQTKELYEKSKKKLTNEVLSIFSNIAILLDKKNEFYELLNNKAPSVELVFPELMKYSCHDLIAFVPNENKVQISWSNIDGAGNISNSIFWEYNFWHESIVRPVLHYTQVFPLIEETHTFSLSNICAKYLSIMRLIEKAKTDKELISYRSIYDSVLSPNVGISSKWKLRRSKPIKIAQKLCNKMNFPAASGQGINPKEIK